MLITDKKFSKSIEHCFAQSHLSVANKQKTLGLNSSTLTVGNGMAFYLGVSSFLTQVIGWGFDVDEVSALTQLRAIESFYGNHSVDINIELSPLCGNTVVELLSQNGYLASEVTNISVLELDSYVPPGQISIDVRLADKSNLSSWAKAVAEGFEHPPAAQEFEVYAQSDSMLPFEVKENGKIVAGATMAIHAPFADLGVTSTLPAFRAKGIQKALLHERLLEAKKRGLVYAVVATEPGSISDLNIQKIGFRCAYTRLKFSKHRECNKNHI